jgi:hypothetical protein
MDYDEHEKTYQMFLRLIKYSIAGVAAILALMPVSGADTPR